MKKRVLLVTLAVVLMVGMLIGGCAKEAVPTEPLPSRISLGTWPFVSTAGMVGLGLSGILEKNLGIEVGAEETKGGAAMIKLMKEGKMELGFGSQSEFVWAFLGKEPLHTTFGGNVPCRVVTHLTEGGSTFVCAADAGVKKLEDLKGKRVMLGSRERVIGFAQVEALLAAGGLTPEDVIEFPAAGLVERIDAIIEGRCDCTILSYDGSYILTLHESPRGASITPIPADKMPIISEIYPTYFAKTVPAGCKPWIKVDTPVAGAARALYTLARIDEELIYQVTKVLIEHTDEVAALHEACQGWTPAIGILNARMPFHDGAIRAYKEAGLWTDELEETQEELLKLGP